MKNILILVSTLFVGVSCQQKENQTAASIKNLDEAEVPVQLTAVEYVSKSEPIVASGLVANTNEARLSFKIGGIIQHISVDEGQKVRQGQILATLNQTEIDAQVTQATLGMKKSERDFRRVQNMYNDTAATLEQMQNATTGFDVAKQTLRIAQFNRSYSKIIAPISGTVIKKMANEGELAAPGSPILFLVSNSTGSWVVRVGVIDKDWTRLKIGDQAQVQLDAYPDIIFEGEVSALTPIADPVNKLYEVEININANNQRLATSMFAKVTLYPTQTRTYAVVPIEALLEGNGREAFVYVLDATGKKVKKALVTTAYIDNNKVLITNGLDSTSQVVTAGGAFLTESSRVAIKP